IQKSGLPVSPVTSSLSSRSSRDGFSCTTSAPQIAIAVTNATSATHFLNTNSHTQIPTTLANIEPRDAVSQCKYKTTKPRINSTTLWQVPALRNLHKITG